MAGGRRAPGVSSGLLLDRQILGQPLLAMLLAMILAASLLVLVALVLLLALRLLLALLRLRRSEDRRIQA